ncbi:spermidine synthase [Actinoalloteichus spitiensis]|uniref:spermidine synthase n=1 Tax=Actinoalloteichus spitiensis TaxID=252394 RepID=UPI000474A7E1|nr:fused MFS/spermidine synthase [Actinoalloteichus spitiensis]
MRARGSAAERGRQRWGGASESREVDQGVAELRPDRDRPSGWTLLVNGTPQSHVDLADPEYLEFEYMRRLAHVIDLAAAPGAPVDAVHLGGGALSLARYLGARRPRSRQRAVEPDARLTEFVRERLPLDARTRVRVSAADAREWLTGHRRDSADLLLVDVFSGARTPAHLTTVEFAEQASRVLRPGGVYGANVGDGPPLAFARGQVATLRAVFPHVLLIAEPGVLRGRRFGNLVLVASHAPLPVVALSRLVSGDPAPARLVEGNDLDAFVGTSAPVRDGSAKPSPAPPSGFF